MSDNLRRHRAIKTGLLQLYPGEAKGHMRQSLEVLAMFINGIVGSKSTHIREVAKNTNGRKGKQSGKAVKPVVSERSSHLCQPHVARAAWHFRAVFPDYALDVVGAPYLASCAPVEREQLVAHEARRLAALASS